MKILTLRKLLLAALLTVTVVSCSNADYNDEIKTTAARKGAKQDMKTYYMGRLAIDVPAEFKLEVQSQTIRYAEVSDLKWESPGNREKERKDVWARKLSEINSLPKPSDKDHVIIKEKNLEGIGT